MKHDEKEYLKFDLNFTYDGASQMALQAVSGSIQKGRCIVLCGASGCGKSTFLRCINRLIPDFYEGHFDGYCYINGKDTASMSIGEVGELTSSVFQDPRSQFYTTNSSSETAFALENYGFPHAEITRRVNTVFSEFGLKKLKDRNVFDLSSGERQLVAILSAHALNNDILLLDEPTANLDAAAVQELARLLAELKQRGKTLLINEHRLYYLRDIADEYWLMDHGKITAKYSKREMLTFSQDELQKKCLRVLDLNQIEANLPPRIISKHENCLKAENITFSYPKYGDIILDKVSFEARSGQVIGLLGSNGSGKTTLGKLITGLFPAASGTFYWNGKPQTPKSLVQKSIFIMQEAEFQFFTNSVWNELLYGRVATSQLKKEVEQKLKDFSLWAYRNKHPFSLSGGQMQKLVMLLAYFSPKPIAVLDEPTAGLDEKSLQACIDLINEMRKSKVVFIITHDMELISKTCGRCLCISKGRLLKEFDLYEKNAIKRLSQYMQCAFKLSENPRPLQQNKRNRFCDSRIKLFYLFTALLISLVTDMVLITSVMLSCLILTLYEKRYSSAFLYSLIYIAIFLSYFLAPQSIMLFIIHYFPRFFPVCIALAAVSESGDTSRLNAALRSWHCPEKVIMIISITFRFFPVLCKDLKIMRQSIQTRGDPCDILHKVYRLPQYFENIVVPMMFRVIRIAETLSASAETRGIAMNRKRDSYVKLHLCGADIFLAFLLAASTLLGIIL